MALNDNALITWEFAKSMLNLEDADQTKTEFYINAISKRVENITGRTFYARDITEYPKGHGDNTIMLKEYPVNSITSLHLDADREFGDSTVVDSDDYHLEEDTGTITLFETTTTAGVKTIKVVYNAGFSTIPEDLQQAVIESIQYNMSRFNSGSVGFENLSGDGMSARGELNIPTSAWMVINQYRRMT